MAKNLLNHRSLGDEAYYFHPLAAVWATERHDLKDASHQKCPHYRGFTVRFTVRPAILLLFEVEWGVDAGCVVCCVGVDFAAVGGCGLVGLVGLIGVAMAARRRDQSGQAFYIRDLLPH